jgi:hypothetical protein
MPLSHLPQHLRKGVKNLSLDDLEMLHGEQGGEKLFSEIPLNQAPSENHYLELEVGKDLIRKYSIGGGAKRAIVVYRKNKPIAAYSVPTIHARTALLAKLASLEASNSNK